MAETFNLNNFLHSYKQWNNIQFTAAENGRAAMEERDIERAHEAVSQNNFLGLTLSEKVAELGVGPRVLKQIGDTAIGAVEDIVSPLTDWLKEYEHVYDQKVYHAEIQSMGKQMFFAKQALAEETASSLVAQKFIMDM